MEEKLVLTILLVVLSQGNGLRICHHNDFHARYAEINRFNSPCSETDSLNGKCYSSIARLQTAFQQYSCDVRIHAGDFVQGSVYDTVFGVDIAIAAYKDLQYDILTFGNHEWNKGPEPVYKTISSLPNSTTWLSSNVMLSAAPKNVTVKQHMNAYGACWVSALTPATLSISNPGPTIFIESSVDALKRSIKRCTQQKNVIAVTHLGYEQDKMLCKSVSELDLVVGGHSHTDLAQGLYPSKVTRNDGSECWVVQASAYGRYLGVLDIGFDSGILQFSGSQYVPLDRRIARDVRTENLVSVFKEQVKASISQVVGSVTSSVDGTRESCRSKECEAGNLLCDAMLSYASAQEGATLCITNGGGIRASFDVGDVTLEEVLTMFPFGNTHATLSVPGSTVKSVLENGLQAIGNDEINGRMPQVAGMNVTASFSAAPGARLRNVTVSAGSGAGSVPIDDTKMYRVVTNGFLANGGDGYQWIGAVDKQTSGRGLDEILVDYLGRNSPYTPKVEGRITDSAVPVTARWSTSVY